MANLRLITRIAGLLVIATLWQCRKDILPYEYNDIYGEWTIRSISGGFAGISVTPRFDILRIDRGMGFSVYRNDTLLANGTVVIKEQTSGHLTIDFTPYNNYVSSFGEGKLVDLHNDTLILYDNCSDCFSWFFVKSNVYSNPVFIQQNRTLDFLDVKDYPIGINNHYMSIYFQNENLGFIACYDGSILKTSDGGKTWKIVPTNNTLPLYTISFINESTGFAAGGVSSCGGSGCTVPGYVMLKTTDSGETWQMVNLPYKPVKFAIMKFFGSDFGIATGPGVALRTNDGGVTWTNFTSDNIKAIYNISFLSDKIAFLAGLKGQLFKTSDGGETWKDIGFMGDNIDGVMFPTEQIGYIGFYNSLWKTTNGGASWKKLDFAPTGAGTMFFNSETSGVVFGIRSYASSKWDVWDSHINILVNSRWYGDERVTYQSDPFCLNPKLYYAITNDNKISVIRITN